MNKTEIVKYTLVISTIILGFYPCLNLCFWVFSYLLEGNMPMIHMVFGIIGYIGLVMMLFKKTSRVMIVINGSFLIIGLFSVLGPLYGKSSLLNWICSTDNLMTWMIYIYPTLVSPIFIAILIGLLRRKVAN